MSRRSVLRFRPLRYRPERVGDLGGVWAPPYDVIGPDDAAALRARSLHNIVRLTNPEGAAPERHREAARTLESWLAEGVLGRNERPALYIHRHTFQYGDARYTRTGVWGLLRLHPFDAGVVLPHERTMRGPKADRLALMRACRAQLSPIFFICSDPQEELGPTLAELAAGRPLERAEFPAGQSHEIWRVDEPERLERLEGLLGAQVFLIADGHHRYETALAYRDGLIDGGAARTGGRAHEFVLAYVVPEHDPGLLLLPTHRLIGGGPVDWKGSVLRLSDRFDVVRLQEIDPKAIEERLAEEKGRPTFVLVPKDVPGGWLLRLRRPDEFTAISSVALQEVFLSEGVGLSADDQVERLTYVKDTAAALAAVNSGAAAAVALLAAPEVTQVAAAAAVGRRTPPKTTFFWPKVPTGIALHRIDPQEELLESSARIGAPEIEDGGTT